MKSPNIIVTIDQSALQSSLDDQLRRGRPTFAMGPIQDLPWDKLIRDKLDTLARLARDTLSPPPLTP